MALFVLVKCSETDYKPSTPILVATSLDLLWSLVYPLAHQTRRRRNQAARYPCQTSTCYSGRDEKIEEVIPKDVKGYYRGVRREKEVTLAIFNYGVNLLPPTRTSGVFILC